MNYWKLGCRWGSKKDGNPLFFELLLKHKIVLSWTDKDYGKNSTLILTDGHTVIGVGKTISEGLSAVEFPEFEDEFRNHNIDFSKDLLIYKAEIYPIEKQDSFDYKLVQGICGVVDNDVKISIKKLITKYQKNMQIENISNLLGYKKQIILQGPPGTGKTRLAKEIALKMIGYNTDIELNNYLKKGVLIPNASGVQNYYLIENVKDNGVELSSERATKKWSASFNKIRETLLQLQLGEIPKNKGGDDPYVLAVAKYIFGDFNKSSEDLKNSDQLKLVQFHPSYTYEDFVRGIIAESKGEKLEYKNVNKTVGLFAKEALANYKGSNNNSPNANIEAWVDNKFEQFKNEIEAKLPEEETILSGEISIFDVAETHFKYAKNWKTPGYLKFSEFKKLLIAILKNEISLDSSQLDKDKFLHAHYRYTYYNALLKKFFANFKYDQKEINVEEKNYVLIIDEINRANLSSVLGELIYALEYRNEPVESMYKVEDSNALILPPNLYIIGTMNTADRSVGHIDYAIRRRFAFVDVLPKNLEPELKDDFKGEIFAKVASLFIANYDSTINYSDENVDIIKSDHMTGDFDPKDVWLGHSYFIQHYEKDENGEDLTEKPFDFRMRIRYEIKPILEEYIKDGILKESARDTINTL